MNIADQFTIRAPLETVWNFLFDIERMSLCVPGVESIEQTGEDTYQGMLAIRIGPVSARFAGKVTLTEVAMPHRIGAHINGEDRTIASFIHADFVSILEEIEDGTQVSYDMDLNVRGRLGQFGTAVTRATAQKITAEFANNVRAELEH